MKRILEQWRGEFLVNHKKLTTLKDVEFKDKENFKVRLLAKRNNRGSGCVEFMLTILLMIAFFTLMIKWHNDEEIQREHINYDRLACTAGITMYMSKLQYYSLQMAEPYDIEEQEVEVVSATDFMKEAKELEKNYDKMIESADESSQYFTGVMSLFGYVPADWEWEYLYRAVKVESGYLEPDNGVMAVVYVIANRCRSDKFPNTIYEVLSQRNQFETWSNGNIQNCNYVEDYFIDIVSDVIAEDPYPEYHDLLYFTSGYYNPYCEPAFVIGHHYFGR